jgi:hypothetical protein
MKRDHFIQQKNKDVLLRSEKEKRVATIKKIYSCFGERVLNIMLSYAITATGLNNLMKKLSIIPKDKDEETIHAEIVNWIYTFGERRFLNIYKNEILKELSTYKVEPVESPFTRPSQTVLSHTKGYPGSPLDSTATVEKGSTPGDALSASSRATKSIPFKEAEKKWTGVEHRKGKDRRVRKARRKDVDVIFKNKRFGGERRKRRDRRKK